MTGHPEDEKIRFFTGTYHLFPAELLVARPVVELDLGCGAGSFTAELARRYPERTVLAADVMVGRLRKLVKRCDRLELRNLEVCRTEARHLVALMLPDGALDRLHLLRSVAEGAPPQPSAAGERFHRPTAPGVEERRRFSLFQR